MVRRLPVLSNANDAEEPERPAWQRVLISSGFVVTLSLPLSTLALPLGPLGLFLAFAVAGFLAGILTGRFIGGAPREAVLGSLIAVGGLGSFAILRGALPLWPLGVTTLAVVTAVVVIFVGLGALLGRKARVRTLPR